MRIFNFSILIDTYDESNQTSELISQTVSNFSMHSTNPIVAGFASMHDDLTYADEDDEGVYNLVQQSDSLDLSGVTDATAATLTYKTELSALPDDTGGGGGSNNVAVDILIVGNSDFEG